jgi:imidazolonepropionase-like amidohydrolase
LPGAPAHGQIEFDLREAGLRLVLWSALAATMGLGACATMPSGSDTLAEPAKAAIPASAETIDPYPSTYARPASPAILIRGGTVLDGDGNELAQADVLMVEGRIAAIGPNLAAPAGAETIDASGKFVTPGIIDAHSHLGVYPAPAINATADGNEITSPNTARVWAEHSVWPMDPGFSRAVAGGVTALHILPGSANLIGGRGVTLRPVLGARTVQGMKFPQAPHSLKMACGENPARVYGERKQAPSTGMGNVAGWRELFIEAQAYQRKWRKHREKTANPKKDAESIDPPDRDLAMESLVGVLEGRVRVQWHCYRADEMVVAIDLAKEFGFKIAAFHHAVEAYKIADVLARENICGAMWADWWGFKIEAYDGVRENIPFVDAAGGCAIVHSDSEIGIQRLNQEAAKALADGRRIGLTISRGQAWTWLSRNPARALGIDGETGTLAVGKAGDVVVWSRDPFSVYALAERVYMDGALAFQRGAERAPPSDFELGHTERGNRP